MRTDGWKGYAGLAKEGYEHHAVRISSSGDPAHVVMPGVHKIASLLKRWMLGTHQGAVTAAHLDAYLDEFAFRFNRRRTPMAAFQTLLGLASGVHGPTSYDMLYSSESTR